ncbi:GNAT family N-acetyltransferase [Phenylobacterium terrae]|uniref:GNAT family N-acetyltransferase n=2 Tax=Phenylobacterium terrae TaxID=2665495 RepID=A0ABW4N685_9CAUL
MEHSDVGLISLQRIDERLSRVHTLCVCPEYQSAGIGARVMKSVMAEASNSGAVVELSVLKANPRAQEFYSRLGFQRIDVSEYHIHMSWSSRLPAVRSPNHR